jgi:hypothetical protein
MGFLKLISIFGAKVTIFLIKCHWKSFNFVVIKPQKKPPGWFLLLTRVFANPALKPLLMLISS